MSRTLESDLHWLRDGCCPVHMTPLSKGRGPCAEGWRMKCAAWWAADESDPGNRQVIAWWANDPLHLRSQYDHG
jgi:hypothetical protein